MIPVEIDALCQGDVIRFTEEGRNQYIVKGVQIHSWEHALRILSFEGRTPGDVMVLATAQLWAVEMWRDMSIPCSGPECDATQTIRINRATMNGPEISMVCSGCRVTSIAELIKRQREEAETDRQIHDTGSTP